MAIISKFVALKNYIPTGLPKETDFEIKSKEISINEKNNILVSNSWISVDPYMRARMTERKNYKPPFKIGEEMEGYAIGKVEVSNDNSLNDGDLLIFDPEILHATRINTSEETRIVFSGIACTFPCSTL